MQTLIKEIPRASLPLYAQHDWVETNYTCARSGYVRVEVSYDDGSPYPDRTIVERVNPYLIQRAQIQRPLNRVKGQRFFKTLDMDYMGSAEFEFGALPKSLSRMFHQRFDYRMHKLEDVFTEEKDCKYACRLYTHFQGDDLDEYVAFLKELQEGKRDDGRQLKESSHFDFKWGLPKRNDFWWDIENDCMWCYDRQYMQRLEGHLDITFKAREHAARGD